MVNGLEGCRTWVSDKTLISLAEALHVEVFQLMAPTESHIIEQDYLSSRRLGLLKSAIKQKVDEAFDEYDSNQNSNKA
jgi:hypothetical protein